MNITSDTIKSAFNAKGAKKQLRAALQAAVEEAPVEQQDTYRRYYASALAADDECRETAIAIANNFLAECINAAPFAERLAVENAIRELLNTETEMDIDAYYAQAFTPAHLQDPVDAYPPEQREAVQELRDAVLDEKLQAKPRPVAEGVCFNDDGWTYVD